MTGRRFGFALSLLAMHWVSCSFITSRIDPNHVKAFLDVKETQYEAICNQAGMAVWNYYSGSDSGEMSAYKERFSTLFGNDTLQDQIEIWSRNLPHFTNDTLARRVTLWKRMMTCAHVDFDPQIMALQNDLEMQLADYSSGNVSDDAIERDIMRLVHLRNARAKEQGYGNYAAMVLQNTGVDTLWFHQLIETLDQASIDAYHNLLKSRGFDTESWIDYSDLREPIIQCYLVNDDPVIATEKKAGLIDQTLSDIGLDIQAHPIQFQVAKLPPGIGGFGNCIDIPNDFRAVAMEELSFYYLLHEIGHGLHWTNVRAPSPIFKGYEWCTGNSSDPYSEAMAETVARFSKSPLWLKQNGFDAQAINDLLQSRKALNPMWLRLELANTLFEIELYRNPDKGAAAIYRELYRKYLNIDRDFSGRSILGSLAYVAYPVYEQNYLLADIISWQIHDTLQKRFGGQYVFNQTVGEFLKTELWMQGELHPWQERVKMATGRELDVKGYLKSLLE